MNSNKNYRFVGEEVNLEGTMNNVFLIHVSMYSMDYIASNLHALFPEYYNNSNPILSISLEHLLAIILDVKDKNTNIFDYWNKRKEYINKHPGMYYDNNELDLYYEIIHDKSMLNELNASGVLDQFDSNCKIISTFRNQFGKEIRPATELINNVESLMLGRIIRYGKTWYGINRRFLKFLDGYLRVEQS